MNRARHRLEAALLDVVGAVARAQVPATARRMGRALGTLWYQLDRPHRRIALENLRLAFPDWTEKRRRSIARAAFQHFGEIGVDLLRFPSYAAQDCERRTVVAGWHHLEEALAKGRGVLLFTGHYGHWELTGLAQGYRGRPLDLVTRPLDNPLLEHRLCLARTRSGNRVVHKRTAVREILRGLKGGRTVGIVMDQNFREPNRIFVDFFGKLAATTPILGILAVRTGAPAIPVFCWPQDGGRYRIEYGPEVKSAPTGDRSEDALRLTSACTRVIEERVRQHPDCWLWMHQRWRTRPATEPSPKAARTGDLPAARRAGG